MFLSDGSYWMLFNAQMCSSLFDINTLPPPPTYISVRLPFVCCRYQSSGPNMIPNCTGAAFRPRAAVAIDVTELEENQVSEEMLENWCVEEQAMEVDIGVLQQVEELERKVTSASLQLKVGGPRRGG